MDERELNYICASLPLAKLMQENKCATVLSTPIDRTFPLHPSFEERMLAVMPCQWLNKERKLRHHCPESMRQLVTEVLQTINDRSVHLLGINGCLDVQLIADSHVYDLLLNVACDIEVDILTGPRPRGNDGVPEPVKKRFTINGDDNNDGGDDNAGDDNDAGDDNPNADDNSAGADDDSAGTDDDDPVPEPDKKRQRINGNDNDGGDDDDDAGDDNADGDDSAGGGDDDDGDDGTGGDDNDDKSDQKKKGYTVVLGSDLLKDSRQRA